MGSFINQLYEGGGQKPEAGPRGPRQGAMSMARSQDMLSKDPLWLQSLPFNHCQKTRSNPTAILPLRKKTRDLSERT